MSLILTKKLKLHIYFILSIKKEIVAFHLCWFKFRCSYICNQGIVNPNQENEGLIFKFRGACIYTWLNVNLYTCCYALHFLLFTDYYNFSGNIVIVFILCNYLNKSAMVS